MRTIKFRGFNKKNNQWLYGSYILNRGKHFIAPDEFADGKTWEDYEVVTESIGQYIGLHDKNGKEIYEGDIVVIPRTPEGRRKAVLARHVVTCIGTVCLWEFSSLTDGVLSLIISHTDFDSYKFEVIGNIIDNPELLNRVG